jgi:RNA polymerase sigma factor (sigma-70 family)
VLYDRCHRLISSVATAVVQRREEAEEITLDVLVRVREKAGTYRSEKARVSTWLARMTRNRAIDVLRREEVRPLKQSISWDSGPALQARARESTEAAAVMTLDKQRMREAMTSLS